MTENTGTTPDAADVQEPERVQEPEQPAAAPGTVGAAIPPDLLAALTALVQQQAGGAAPTAEQPKPKTARLVLATGRTVEAENTNTTEHFDPEAGVTVPVLSSYLV